MIAAARKFVVIEAPSALGHMPTHRESRGHRKCYSLPVWLSASALATPVASPLPLQP